MLDVVRFCSLASAALVGALALTAACSLRNFAQASGRT